MSAIDSQYSKTDLSNKDQQIYCSMFAVVSSLVW